jgi:hypothetical protein
MTTATAELIGPSELKPDNATRLAIFDAMSDAANQGHAALTVAELYERVIGRLRLLVPRELHNAGERAYLEEKIGVCVKAGLLIPISKDPEQFALAAHPQPWIQYPDGTIRPYTPGLIAAREQLDAVNSTLREQKFDIGKHVPHHKPGSPEFAALVRSMQEHGFLRQFAIFRFPDGTYVDGQARVSAATEAGVDPKWLDLEKLRDPEKTRAKRRDTPLNRALLALDSNAARLSAEARRAVLDDVAAAAGRSWDDIESDLNRTWAWRQATTGSYTPVFAAEEHPYEPNGTPEILVTSDHKVGVRSLLVASRLKLADRDTLKDYMPYEMAKVGSSKPTLFARADHLIAGIEDMLADPKRRKDPAEWERALTWLRAYVKDNRLNTNGAGSR